MTGYYDKKRAATNIAGELLGRGWNVYDYKPYEMAGFGDDYGTPASWCGIATHEKYPDFMLCVDVDRYMAEMSGKNIERSSAEPDGVPCVNCGGRGCSTCGYIKMTWHAVRTPWFTYPLGIQETKGFWHAQYKGRIVGKGRNYNELAKYPDYGKAKNHHVVQFCDELEAIADRVTKNKTDVVNTTAPVMPGLQIIAEYESQPGKPGAWTWLAFQPYMGRDLWNQFWPIFKERFGAEYSRKRHKAYIPRRVEQEDLNKFAHDWNTNTAAATTLVEEVMNNDEVTDAALEAAVTIGHSRWESIPDKESSLAIMYGSTPLSITKGVEVDEIVEKGVELRGTVAFPAEKKMFSSEELDEVF